MVEDDFPWPQKGDRLFGADSDWWHNACPNYAWNPWHAYSTGYRCAADILVAFIDSSGREQDTLVYPIVFLYRSILNLR